MKLRFIIFDAHSSIYFPTSDTFVRADWVPFMCVCVRLYVYEWMYLNLRPWFSLVGLFSLYLWLQLCPNARILHSKMILIYSLTIPSQTNWQFEMYLWLRYCIRFLALAHFFGKIASNHIHIQTDSDTDTLSTTYTHEATQCTRIQNKTNGKGSKAGARQNYAIKVRFCRVRCNGICWTIMPYFGWNPNKSFPHNWVELYFDFACAISILFTSTFNSTGMSSTYPASCIFS